MPRVIFETKMSCSVQELWDFHSSAEALQVLCPPGQKVKFLSKEMEVREGVVQTILAFQYGLPTVWKVRIHEVTPPEGFTDTAIFCPFKSWSHRHDFLPDGEGCLLRDTIEYEPRFGELGKVMDRVVFSKQIAQLFEFRHRVTAAAVGRVVAERAELPSNV